MKKAIIIEADFPDGFIPPEELDDPTAESEWKSKCDPCPFFKWNERSGYGWCAILGEEPATYECPIKKNF